MRKLLIVPAILAMTCMSGSAFAQRNLAVQNTGSPVSADGSTVVPVLSPALGVNAALNAQISALNSRGSGNQNNTNQQATAGSVGISGGNSISQGR
jgi:hypothetical protein